MLKPSPEGEGFNPTRTCDNKDIEETFVQKNMSLEINNSL